MKKSKQEKRPSSDNFVDLHIFVVPYELWMEKYRTAYNSSTLESISAGFVRVPPLMTLEDLRIEIKEELGGADILPEEFVFLRCVGRCLAIVNKVQELSLKVKHFLPPVVSSPEIFVLFGNHDSLSHTLASSANTAQDLQDFGNVEGYLTYSRENSRFSSPEKARHDMDTADVLQRRVHFQQNRDESKNENFLDDSEKTIPENVHKRVEGTFSTELPEAVKSDTASKEPQLALPWTDGKQDYQKPRSQTRRISSELPMEQNLQDDQVDSGNMTNGGIRGKSRLPTNQNLQDDPETDANEVNGVASRTSSSRNKDYHHDANQVSSSFEDQHTKSPRSNKIQRKNPLIHSKTAPSLLQTPWDGSNDDEMEGNEGNGRKLTGMRSRNETTKRKNETRSRHDENAESYNNEEEENDRMSEYPNNVKLIDKNETEMIDKTKDTYKHSGLASDKNRNNYQKKFSNETDEDAIVDSLNENVKHSAENSVASSGFESLNQSANNGINKHNVERNENDSANNSVNKHNIERNENDFGVTMADKENLVLQLQAELSDIRSERSNSEKAREQLLKKAKNLQNQNNQKRNQAKSVWKKRYFEEKKKTVSLEERCNQLRYEVEVIHKKILSSSDSKDRDSTSGYVHQDGDPKKLNTRIMLTRKENEVEELRRRVEEARIKLSSEMKLRDNAQKELKQIRDEVIDKKINATLVKKSLSLLETRPSHHT